MANMGYCRFENTSIDLQDCLWEIQDMANEEKSLDRLSETEKRKAETLMEQCQEYIELYEEISEND